MAQLTLLAVPCSVVLQQTGKKWVIHHHSQVQWGEPVLVPAVEVHHFRAENELDLVHVLVHHGCKQGVDGPRAGRVLLGAGFITLE